MRFYILTALFFIDTVYSIPRDKNTLGQLKVSKKSSVSFPTALVAQMFLNNCSPSLKQ